MAFSDLAGETSRNRRYSGAGLTGCAAASTKELLYGQPARQGRDVDFTGILEANFETLYGHPTSRPHRLRSCLREV